MLAAGRFLLLALVLAAFASARSEHVQRREMRLKPRIAGGNSFQSMYVSGTGSTNIQDYDGYQRKRRQTISFKVSTTRLHTASKSTV